MHPWHDVEPGPAAPELCNCVIEIPAGSTVTKSFKVERVLDRLDACRIPRQSVDLDARRRDELVPPR